MNQTSACINRASNPLRLSGSGVGLTTRFLTAVGDAVTVSVTVAGQSVYDADGEASGEVVVGDEAVEARFESEAAVADVDVEGADGGVRSVVMSCCVPVSELESAAADVEGVLEGPRSVVMGC